MCVLVCGRITSCHTMPCPTLSWQVMPWHAIFGIPWHAVTCHAISRNVRSCLGMASHVMPCIALLLCVMSCQGVTCHVLPRRVTSRSAKCVCVCVCHTGLMLSCLVLSCLVMSCSAVCHATCRLWIRPPSLKATVRSEFTLEEGAGVGDKSAQTILNHILSAAPGSGHTPRTYSTFNATSAPRSVRSACLTKVCVSSRSVAVHRFIHRRPFASAVTRHGMTCSTM